MIYKYIDYYDKIMSGKFIPDEIKPILEKIQSYTDAQIIDQEYEIYRFSTDSWSIIAGIIDCFIYKLHIRNAYDDIDRDDIRLFECWPVARIISMSGKITRKMNLLDVKIKIYYNKGKEILQESEYDPDRHYMPFWKKHMV